jgi:2,3-bisphosphoglycerate-dependent phosphoglycerate mutase
MMKNRKQIRALALGLLMVATGTTAAEEQGQERASGPEIWLVRHAESEINVTRGPLPEPDTGVSYPLTALGVSEAAALAQSFADVPVAAIYSSTRLRTLQTANAISLQTGVPLKLAPAAVEIDFGPTADLQDVPVVVARWLEGELDARLSDSAENLLEVRQRFLPFWQDLLEEHRETDGVVVLVTHGGIISFVLPELCPELTMQSVMVRFIRNAQVVRTRLDSDGLSCFDWHGESLI